MEGFNDKVQHVSLIDETHLHRFESQSISGMVSHPLVVDLDGTLIKTDLLVETAS